jgi:hypothetical protein
VHGAVASAVSYSRKLHLCALALWRKYAYHARNASWRQSPASPTHIPMTVKRFRCIVEVEVIFALAVVRTCKQKAAISHHDLQDKDAGCLLPRLATNPLSDWCVVSDIHTTQPWWCRPSTTASGITKCRFTLLSVHQCAPDSLLPKFHVSPHALSTALFSFRD